MAKPRRRMMIADLYPKKRMPRVFATLNAADKAGTVTILGSNIATGSGGVWGIVRATQAITGGQHYWETLYGFTTGDVAAGIATADHSLTVALGSVTGATTGPDKSGDFYRNGILILNLSSLTTGVVIRHWLDADAGIYRVAIGAGSWIEVSAVVADTNQVWYPALAVKNAVCTANFGLVPFVYDVPPGVRAGVYEDPIETITLRLSSHKLNTGPSDDPPNTPYEARITSKGSDVWIEREGSCHVWGNQTRSSRGELSIVVADGKVDDWKTLIWRDAKVVIRRGYQGDTIDQFTHWTTARVETNKADRRRLLLTLTDELARLDRQIRIALYPDDQPNEQLAHRALPLCMGSPLYCEGALLSTSEFGDLAFAYDLHFDAVFDIGDIYDRGDVFVPGTDWTFLPGRTGFKLEDKPDGKVVANPTGGLLRLATYINASNGGAFDAWSAGAYDDDPDGWTVISDSSGRHCSPTMSATACELNSSGGRKAWMQHQATTLALGDLHLVVVDVLSVTGTGIYVAEEGTTGVYIDTQGKHRLLIEGSSSGYFEIRGDDSADGTVVIDNVEVYKVRVAEYLPDWVRYLCVQLAGMDEAMIDWDAINALNEKTRTPYRLAHYSNSTSETYQQLLRMTGDCFCGGFFTNRAGLLSVGCVELPSNPVLTLNKHNLKRPPVRSPDLAPGLRTRLAGGRNHAPHTDADIVPSASMELRARLKAEWTIVRSGLPASVRQHVSTPKVSVQVGQAEGGEPQGTLLQDASAVQTEASRINTLWRDANALWACEAILQSSQADNLEPFQSLTLQWDGDGLNEGRDMLVKYVRSGFWSNAVSLIVFDPLQPEAI